MTIAILKIPGTNIKNLLTALPGNTQVSMVKRPEDLPIDTNWIILPGVGHFSSYMAHLMENGWCKYLTSDAFSKNEQKILGICSGFHALCRSSEEASGVKGLGLFEIDVTSCPLDINKIPAVKSPHVGRKPIIETSFESEMPKLTHAFFTHSFTVACRNATDEVQKMSIGDGMFVAAMKLGKIHGVQYHPELSGDEGFLFLKDLLI